VGAAVTLLQIVPDTGSPFDRTGEIAIRESLRALATELSLEGLEVTAALTAGSIADVACTGHCDLVVMASHGVAELRDVGMPLLLLGPAARPCAELETLLVLVDEAPRGLQALGMATPLAQVTGARIVVAEAVVPSSSTASLNPFESYWEEARLARATTFVADLAARLASRQIQAEAVARFGQVAATIVSIADKLEPDLIVMSARSPEADAQDGIAEPVVRAARCPVLLVDRDPTSLNGTVPVERTT
jgi:nucleotide-binding universal stress UspA family protein